MAANAAFTDAWRNLGDARIAIGDALNIKGAMTDSGRALSDALMHIYGPDTVLTHMDALNKANQANDSTRKAYEGAVQARRNAWNVFAETGRAGDLRAVADARQAQAEAAQDYAKARQSIAGVVWAMKQTRDNLRQSEEFAAREAAYKVREDSMRAVQAAQAEAERQRQAKVEAQAEAERQRQAATTTTAEALDKAYDDNPVAADQKYKGKTWTVIGTVSRIESEYINLKGDGFIDMGLNCYFTAASYDRVAQIQDGDLIRVEGVVQGYDLLGFFIDVRPCTVR